MASILQRLASQVVSAKSSWDSVFTRNLETKYFGDDVVKLPYSKSELVYICISTTAKAISQVPLKVMQPAKRRGGDKTFLRHVKQLAFGDPYKIEQLVKSDDLDPVPADNPYQERLDYPSATMSGKMFKEAIIGHIMLDGNVWILPFPPGIPEPHALWIIKRSAMDYKLDDRTNQLLYWIYKPTTIGKGVPLGIDEIIHLRTWNPYETVLGQRPLEAGILSVRTDHKAGIYNELFFDEGAVPGGLLQTEQKLGDKQFSRVQTQFESRHKGVKKAWRVAVLEQGLKYEQIGLSQRDMQFINLRKYNRETVMQIFGIKKAIISVTDDLNYATAHEQRKEWWQDTNLPMMRLVTDSINSTLLFNTPFICRWDISTIEALQEEYDKKVTTAYKLWQMGFTANEINTKLELGFKNVSWRDVAYFPSTLVPVGPGDSATDPGDNNNDGEEQLIAQPKTLLLQLGSGKGFTTDEETLFSAYAKRLEEVLDPLERKFEGKVTKVFYKMRTKSLKMLNVTGKTLDQLSMEEFLEEAELLSSSTEEIYASAIESGVRSAAQEIGIKPALDLVNADAVGFLRRKAMKIVGVKNTIQRQIRNEIRLGVAEGESIPEISDRIRSVFNFANKRAITIARTEVIGVSNYGRNAQMRMVMEWKKWFTALNERVRASHAAVHGMVIAVDQSWIVGGAALKFPGDPDGPPKQIVNCRCIEVATERPPGAESVPIPAEDIKRLRDEHSLKHMSPARVKGFVKGCYR